MSVYYTLNRNGNGDNYWQERKGRRVRNNHGLELFAERQGENYWVITEIKTGMKIAEGDLRKNAVQNLIDKIEHWGIDYIQERLDIAISRFGKSPLYTDNVKFPIVRLEKEGDSARSIGDRGNS